MFASSVATRSTPGPRPIAAVMVAIAAGAPARDLLVGLASVTYADTSPADPSSVATPTIVSAGTVPTTSGLTASFNGGGSSDPDGTVAARVGKYVDNTAESGTASSHVNAAAGIHFVSLTVTDKQGATLIVANPETAVARVTPPGTLLARSQFGTPTTNSWGGGRDQRKTDERRGGNRTQRRTWRRSDAAPLKWHCFASRTRAGDFHQLDQKERAHSGIRHNTDDDRVRACDVGTVKPTGWQHSATDLTATHQVLGSMGLHSHLSFPATGHTVTSRFDDFTVSQP